MWSTIVAVLGTLAGVALAGYAQRSGDRQAREHAHRQDVTHAVAQLLEAILRHREVHWLSVESRRTGAAATGSVFSWSRTRRFWVPPRPRGGRPSNFRTSSWAR